MIVPERTVHRFDQFSRSVNGIVNLRAPVEWFGRCRDTCQSDDPNDAVLTMKESSALIYIT
jgi:hypothetical protein